HDPALPIDERLKLAETKPHERKLMAAMAQLDCGACGYVCQTYAEAIARGEEKDLARCTPGGKDTAKALKQLLAAAPGNVVPVSQVRVRKAAADSPASGAATGMQAAEWPVLVKGHAARRDRSARQRHDLQTGSRTGRVPRELPRTSGRVARGPGPERGRGCPRLGRPADESPRRAHSRIHHHPAHAGSSRY